MGDSLSHFDDLLSLVCTSLQDSAGSSSTESPAAARDMIKRKYKVRLS